MPSPNNLIDHQPLVKQLNTLLDALDIPIPLDSPTQLTPSLLIAILESLLHQRIVRDARAKDRETENMRSAKIFLGVLQTEVLEIDVGLSNIDPRKLARGDLDEVIFIGELLCWVARRLGRISGDDRDTWKHAPPTTRQDVYSPPMTATTKKTYADSSFSFHRHTESNTSVDSAPPSKWPPKRSTPPPIRPRCIHEVPSLPITPPPKFNSSFEQSFCPCADPRSPRKPAVRYSGYISPVDEDFELLSFESSRSMSDQKPADDDVKDDNHEYTTLLALQQSRVRTRALLNERARLLAELAKVEGLHPP